MKGRSLLFFLIAWAGGAVGLEEPRYEVIETRGDYEVRRYDPYLVAETVVEGSFKSSGNKAFRILASYIFGNNTTPDGTASAKMAMTAPVALKEAEVRENHYAYWFVMERQYDRDSLPVPTDPRIEIREVPGRLVAARRYSGRTTEQNFEQNLQALRHALDRDGLAAVGTAQAAVYNGPFTLPFMRRNEVLIEIVER